MKPTGPFTSKVIECYGVRVIDGKGNWVAKVDTMAFARRIAAALNRDEARKTTKRNARWSGGEFDDSTPYLAYDGETIYDMSDVAALLNKLGATLPKRTPARKGKAR